MDAIVCYLGLDLHIHSVHTCFVCIFRLSLYCLLFKIWLLITPMAYVSFFFTRNDVSIDEMCSNFTLTLNVI